MFRTTTWIAVVFATLMAGGDFKLSKASAQNIPNPSCAKANGDFVCIGALDGTTIQQIIVGNWNVNQTNGPNNGFVIIIENTGNIRKRICMGESCPTITVQ
jgi:hypothetical protein